VRRRVVAACAVLAFVLAGCGEPAEDTTSGSLVLTVYTSGTLQGDRGDDGRDGADAVKLALEQAGGMVGQFTVNVVSLDDTDPEKGRWGPEQTVGNARRAIADRNIIAYISNTDSAATALTLPLLNEAGVLQVGPATGYVGLTRRAGRGEPERFYPSGVRSFGRVAPADDLEADALLGEMQRQGVQRLAIVHDGELDALGVTALVTKRANAAGIRVVAEEAVDADEKDGSGVAEQVVDADADAALYTGTTTQTAPVVLEALHEADPELALYGTDGLADQTLASSLDDGTARRLMITSPVVPLEDLPPAADRFGRAFQRAYGREPAPSAVLSYEAMRAILDAIRRAGAKGNDRVAVMQAYFGLRLRDTALGSWSVTPTGDSTLRRYGLWRVRDGRLTFLREAP